MRLERSLGCHAISQEPWNAANVDISCAYLHFFILIDEAPSYHDSSAPLDYFDPSAGTAKIALARYKATKSPKKGMVLWNPGGPGKMNPN